MNEQASAGEKKYNHVEAFCLMKYATKDGAETEIVWNSRDGVTPYIIPSKSGAEMSHVDWRNDTRTLDYQPKPGDRIFVDLGAERAKKLATERVERYWDHPEYPMSRMYGTKEEAVEGLLKANEFAPDAPHLVEWTPEMKLAAATAA